MNPIYVFDLLTNILLLLSLSVVYSLFTNRSSLSTLNRKLIMGVSVSFVGIIIMFNTVQVDEGIIFDGRSVLMLLSGIYFGVIPTVMGALTLSLNRIRIGGAGTVPGVLWVIIPSVIGLVWRHFRIKRETADLTKIRISELYLVLLLTQVVVVGLLFLFPNKVPVAAIEQVAVPLVLFYPLGGVLVSIFMLRLRINYVQAVEIEEREKEYNDLFHLSASYSFLINPITGEIRNVNEVAINRYGYTLEEFTSMTFYDISYNTHDNSKIMSLFEGTSSSNYITCTHILSNREIMDVEVRGVPITIEGEDFFYATVTDITERIIDELRYQDVNVRLEATLLSVSEGIISTNEFGEIEIVNEVAKRYIKNQDKIIGKKVYDVVNIYSKDNTNRFTDIYNTVIKDKSSYQTKEPFLLINPNDDTTIYIDFSLSAIKYENDIVRGSILVFRDVTNQFEQTNQIQYISQHDYLTGLYNRYFLEAEMKRLDTKRQLPISIIHGDINGLKLTNDTFGHIEGDNLLQEISDILRKATRSEDIISRWGGDEFIILLPQTSNENAKKVIRRIRDLQKKSMYSIITPSISLGLATKTDEDDDLSRVLIDAEVEMYANKQIDGKRMREEFLKRIDDRINALHPDLAKHSANVMRYLEEFGTYLELDDIDLNQLITAGKYHDVGWVTIKPELLLKTDPLTEQELFKIRGHVEVGFRILKSIPELSHISEIILYHHERYDGEGYPTRQSAKNIPYLSRIITIIDAYDMMINNSIYSPIMSSSEALEELKLKSGTQFDPNLVQKFINMKQQK